MQRLDATLVTNLCGDAGDLSLGARDERDVCTRARERKRDGPADTTAAAGDECELILQLHGSM
jgi:hypothetical protein